jgi:hypothetical protein
MYALLAVLFALALVTPAHAQVHVDIGIHLPAPPQLVIVPQIPEVRYVPAPAAPANLFFYSGQYWAFANGGWHVSTGYNGPWVVVGPQFVPRPILRVPVQYYPVPPDHWNKWERKHAPRWQEDWGPEWADKRGWKERDGDEDRPERGRGQGRGRGHGRD